MGTHRLTAALLFVVAAACGGVQRPPPPAWTRANEGLLRDLDRADDALLWRAHFIDVGQGLAVLHEFPCGAYLIDTGGEQDEKFDSNSAIAAYLTAFFARRPDLDGTLAALLLTHPHIDHTRGVETVLQRFRVRNLIDNGQDGGSGAQGQRALQAFARDHSDIGYRAVALADITSATGLSDAVIDPLRCADVDPQVRALWGRVAADPGWPGLRFGRTPFGNQNNHSVVVRIDFGQASGLFTGDLEEPAIKDLIARTAGTGLLDVLTYQVGHHGSINGTLPELCAAMSPEVAVFATGPASWQLTWSAWKYGHPRQEIVAMLEAVIARKRRPLEVPVGVKGEQFVRRRIDRALYATGWDGTVIVESRADGRQRVLIAGR